MESLQRVQMEKWQCLYGIRDSLSSLEKQGGWLQRGLIHQKVQKSAEIVQARMFYTLWY